MGFEDGVSWGWGGVGDGWWGGGWGGVGNGVGDVVRVRDMVLQKVSPLPHRYHDSGRPGDGERPLVSAVYALEFSRVCLPRHSTIPHRHAEHVQPPWTQHNHKGSWTNILCLIAAISCTH